MKNNNIITLLGLLFFFVLMGIAFFSFFDLGNRQTTQSQASSFQITPSIEPYTILRTDPPFDSSKKQLPILQIDFVFNDIVNPKTFYYEVSPKVETYFKTQGSKLTLYPKNVWQLGTTTITLLPETTGAHGRKLKKPFIYKFDTALPEDIN